ncbi:MAG: hypothetical protein FJW40_15695 [Acidobacteria bacterium]|nr:hypothetical protein [Acidobacteriota bacterium]
MTRRLLCMSVVWWQSAWAGTVTVTATDGFSTVSLLNSAPVLNRQGQVAFIAWGSQGQTVRTWHPDSGFTTIAGMGTPSTAGGMHDGFQSLRLAEDGSVGFVSLLKMPDRSYRQGVFVYSGDPLNVPDFAATTYLQGIDSIESLVIGNGAVAFRGAGATSNTMFASNRPRGPVELPSQGDHSPDPSINAAGQIAWFVRDGLGIDRLVTASGSGPSTELANTAAGSGYLALGSPVINSHGAVAYHAVTTSGAAIHRWNGASTTSLVETGVSAGGGTLREILPLISFSNSGHASFLGITNASSGVFRTDGSSVETVAMGLYPAPGSTSHFTGFGQHQINHYGAVAFTGYTAEGAGLYIGDGRDLYLIARPGQDTADGRVIAQVSQMQRNQGGAAAINAFGQVVYAVSLSDGAEEIRLYTPDLQWRNPGGADWAHPGTGPSASCPATPIASPSIPMTPEAPCSCPVPPPARSSGRSRSAPKAMV